MEEVHLGRYGVFGLARTSCPSRHLKQSVLRLTAFVLSYMMLETIIKILKPLAWYKIEAQHRRFYILQKEIVPQKKMPTGKNPGTAADGQHRQYG